MFEYGFKENVDYQAINEFVRHKTGAGGTNKKDYALTLDCAKEISMIQRTEKGKEARLYFIACEKKLKEMNSFQVPKTLSQALLLASQQAEQIENLQLEKKKMRQKSIFLTQL